MKIATIYFLVAMLYITLCAIVISYRMDKKIYGTASFDQKIEKFNNQNNQKGELKNGIFWTKRAMTFISENGKVEEVQVGLDTNGYFVWKTPSNQIPPQFTYQR